MEAQKEREKEPMIKRPEGREREKMEEGPRGKTGGPWAGVLEIPMAIALSSFPGEKAGAVLLCSGEDIPVDSGGQVRTSKWMELKPGAEEAIASDATEAGTTRPWQLRRQPARQRRDREREMSSTESLSPGDGMK